MSKRIYLDNAATTKTATEVVEAMLPYFTENYGNPSSVYDLAATSKEAITKAREQIAAVIGAEPKEIYFTAGGTEADNWALEATYELLCKKGNHIITTKIEHHAILHTCEYLEKNRGARVTYLDVDENGIVKLEDLEKAITPETILISVMFANNEIEASSQSKRLDRLRKSMEFIFTRMRFRHLGRCRLTWTSIILICSVPALIRLTVPKASVFSILEKE